MKTPKEGMIMESPSKDSMSVYRNGEWVIYHSASSIAALPAPSPTGDRDCEELRKEVERLNGENFRLRKYLDEYDKDYAKRHNIG